MRLTSRIRRLVLAASAVTATLFSFDAHAEVDNFGVGDGHSGAKTVAGTEIINSYASITADVTAGQNVIAFGTVIGDAAGFAAGDLIVVWRSTGVAASEAPSGDTTKRVDLPTALATTSSAATQPGLAGEYELARVAAVNGASLTLTQPLVKSFTKNVSQIVRVPEYTTLTVPAGATITAAAWQEVGGTPAAPNPDNPWAGGIVVFMVSGAISNEGTIHANARGFHGGLPIARPINPVGVVCNNTAVDGNAQNDNPLAGTYAPKGQGIVHAQYLPALGGKGNISMAGGGGNCVEGGGGGGANAGNGGSGSASIANLGAGGFGGVGVDYDVMNRLSMGGGGGAGRHIANLISQVSFGGFGGGVVYIRGGSMSGNGLLQANGGNGEDSGLLNLPVGVASEGSGGGGAGGTVVVRLTGTLDCDSLGSPGGNGGSAAVLGLGIFGAGGGGGGGRVLFQAATKTDRCDIIVAPGNPGNNGQGGSQPGNPGTTQPPPDGGFCFDPQPGNPNPCADPTPVCDTTTGVCNKCTGPFGGGSPHACKINVEPVCMTDGSCVPCNGDYSSGASQACQLLGSPYCHVTGAADVVGACGKCTTNADCAGAGHPGPVCNVDVGNCGTTCVTDADCKPAEWCAPTTGGMNVCTPKVPNGQPLPDVSPINGECTEPNGKRVCISAVCEPEDDLCGLKNGSQCRGADQCRTNICFSDARCGLPSGEPCTGSDQCRSGVCEGGTCKGCDDDTDCRIGQVCDVAANTCIADDFGLVEGGGCSCNTTTTSTVSPIALLGIAIGGAFLKRRRERRDSGRG